MPLIRVLKHIKDGLTYSYFIEPSGRTYDGWNDFIDNNKLPECDICYPKGISVRHVLIFILGKPFFQMDGILSMKMMIVIYALENRLNVIHHGN